MKARIGKCPKCRRSKAMPYSVPEGQLPKFQTKKAFPWSTTGIDHLGSLFTRDGSKVYVLLFTCTLTRPINLEVCKDLPSEETHLRIWNFLSLRVPQRAHVQIWSDNHRSFVKAATMPFPTTK